MIKAIKSGFLLSAGDSSIVLFEDAHKKVSTEYFGLRVPDGEGDASAYAEKRAYAPGTSISYDESDPSYVEDRVKGEFSTLLKGDFHTPSLMISNDETSIFDFRLARSEIRKPKELKTLPTPHGADEELVLYLDCPETKTTLELHYLTFEKEGVFARSAVIANNGEKPIYIDKAMSLQLVLPNRDDSIIACYGAWGAEGRKETYLAPHAKVEYESLTGGSSNRHNPLFLLKEGGANLTSGSVYGFNLVYSGNFLNSIEQDSHHDLYIQSGISPTLFRKELAKDERFETPWCVFAYSHEGVSGLSRAFQRFVNAHIIPEPLKDAPRPIVYNNWEATYFSFDERKIHSLMKKAASLGIETFVLDDGWFGRRDDDHKGLGDWYENKKKLPHGLKGLAEKAQSLGMSFGIWMEPEMVNEDSDLYRAHPDWIIRDPLYAPSKSRNQWTLDLTKKEVRDFVYESVSKVLDSAPISYLKWDYNRNMSDAHIKGGRSSFYHDYIVGLYDVLRRIRAEHPTLFIENCASGGNRFDLGMLSYCSSSWQSDDTDCHERNLLESFFALGYPASVLSNHVSAKVSNQLLRRTPLDSKFDIAAFGVLGYELDLDDLTEVDKAVIKGQIDFYKRHRKTLQFGDLYVLSDFSGPEGAAYESIIDDEAIVGRFPGVASIVSPEGRLTAIGLDPEAIYHYRTRQESIPISSFGYLINAVSPVRLDPDGPLAQSMGRKRDMKGEVDEGDMSGAALMSYGAPLSQAWEGTGYDEHVRAVLDFGGRLYTITKQKG
jgi:alpha-galactosidase